MNLTRLLMFAGIGEGATGLGLAVAPALVVRLLLGAEITDVGTVMSRIYGVSLVTLAMACWPGDTPRREFYSMATYCIFATFYLGCLGFSGLAGILMWPAVAVHAALSVLLVWAWRKEQSPAVGK